MSCGQDEAHEYESYIGSVYADAVTRFQNGDRYRNSYRQETDEYKAVKSAFEFVHGIQIAESRDLERD